MINKLAPLFVIFKTGTNFVLHLYINTAAILKYVNYLRRIQNSRLHCDCVASPQVQYHYIREIINNKQLIVHILLNSGIDRNYCAGLIDALRVAALLILIYRLLVSR